MCYVLTTCTVDFEYEVAWQGLASLKFNRWLPRAELVEKGFRKYVVEFDQRLASNALGNDARPLTKESITKFLQDFGLEPEFGVHSNIRGLSGGQKVKLVLAVSVFFLNLCKALRSSRATVVFPVISKTSAAHAGS